MYKYNVADSQTTATDSSLLMKNEIPLNVINADHYHHQTTSLLSYRSAPSSFFADLVDGGLGSGSGDLFSADEDETASMLASFMDSASESGSGDLQFEVKLKVKPEEECPLVQDNGHVTLTPRDLGAGFHTVKSNGTNFSSSNLIRHSSSPAGFFTTLNFGNENADGNFQDNTGELNFSSGQCFSARFIPQNVEEGTMDHLKESSNISHGYHIPKGFQSDSWINPSSITGMKRRREGNDVNQNGRFHPSIHQETLPEWLQFQQDSVPCKLRARRGFATHPRSIAERTRRTRISDRMKKLQDLFPNMEKTSISDMLDLAVEHIKNLQKHVEMLTDNQSRCTCSIQQE